MKYTYLIDIDGTICTNTNGKYEACGPYVHRIKYVNKLYSLGHTIKLFTARGATSGKDWRELTEKQLKDWGVDYHELIMGKPHYDIHIDDKSINAQQYFDFLKYSKGW